MTQPGEIAIKNCWQPKLWLNQYYIIMIMVGWRKSLNPHHWVVFHPVNIITVIMFYKSSSSEFLLRAGLEITGKTIIVRQAPPSPADTGRSPNVGLTQHWVNVPIVLPE